MNRETFKRANELVKRIETLKRTKTRITERDIFKVAACSSIPADILDHGEHAMAEAVDLEIGEAERELEGL